MGVASLQGEYRKMKRVFIKFCKHIPRHCSALHIMLKSRWGWGDVPSEQNVETFTTDKRKNMLLEQEWTKGSQLEDKHSRILN